MTDDKSYTLIKVYGIETTSYNFFMKISIKLIGKDFDFDVKIITKMSIELCRDVFDLDSKVIKSPSFDLHSKVIILDLIFIAYPKLSFNIYDRSLWSSLICL